MRNKKSKITFIIGVSKTTITRKIQPNSDRKSYVYHFKLAQCKSEKGKQEKPKKTYFTSLVKIRVKSKEVFFRKTSFFIMEIKQLEAKSGKNHYE